MRIKKPTGEWEFKSSKTSDLEEAKQRAMDRYDELKFRQKHDMPLEDNRKFGDAAKAYEKELEELKNTGAGKPIHKTYLQILAKWLVPFFGDKNIHEIDAGVMKDYDNYVRTNMGHEPAKSTYNAHNVIIRAVFDVAVRKKWIKRSDLPITTVKGKGKKAIRRPHFENDEWNRLTNLMHGKWRTSSKLWLSNYKRQVLRIQVLVLGNTGMRPGTEPRNLKWKDVSEHKLTNKQVMQQSVVQNGEPVSKVIRFRVVGKTSEHETEGHRMVIARHNVHGWLEELKEITGRTDKDDLLFCMPNGEPITDLDNMFKQFLQETDLLYNAAGVPRTLYSLRHMYATMRVRKGIPYQALAMQMGTSTVMIERHYAHNKVDEWAAELAG